MWPATVTISVRSAPASRHSDELLGEPVDEVRAVDVPADVEPDERDAAPPLDRHDLAEEDRGVLREVVAGFAGDGDAERAEMARQDGRVGVEVDRVARPRRAGSPSPPPTLTSRDRVAGGAQPRRPPRPPARGRARTRRARPRASPIRHGNGPCRSRRSCRAAAAIASSSRSRPMPNFVGRSPAYSRCSL